MTLHNIMVFIFRPGHITVLTVLTSYVYIYSQRAGYVIMDDWYGFPSKDACEDFFKVHNMNPTIVRVDDISAYWQKTEQVTLEYWRYEKKDFIKQ
jgi:hypothetical protein